MYRQHASHYKRQEIQTASPGKIVVMLFDGAIKNLNTAEKAYENKDYKQKSTALVKVQDIILELMNALNNKQGGDIAARLESLYSYALRRLIDADLNKDKIAIREVREILSEIREAFAEIVHNNHGTENLKTG